MHAKDAHLCKHIYAKINARAETWACAKTHLCKHASAKMCLGKCVLLCKYSHLCKQVLVQRVVLVQAHLCKGTLVQTHASVQTHTHLCQRKHLCKHAFPRGQPCRALARALRRDFPRSDGKAALCPNGTQEITKISSSILRRFRPITFWGCFSISAKLLLSYCSGVAGPRAALCLTVTH